MEYCMTSSDKRAASLFNATRVRPWCAIVGRRRALRCLPSNPEVNSRYSAFVSRVATSHRSDGPQTIALFTKERRSDLGFEPGACNSKDPLPDAVITPEDETENVRSGEALRV